ncbi:MAG: dihydrodipicolinate synthase family protein [Rhodospirillaceae bacterium]|jgi:4-hydroxy-tetrahydrodipicolinate synthase|nr:dihydrodipicolinate synthase family protein [Rhodospirillaceae bacterium]MBT4218408.1 dihydrodipicolinate synthase family protein [Rhodospirillaceae bacterium]MBT4464439.1 dihydrodipicolinate synthase family protein [Rhodospirillaceae bacterium]MBT5014451.1 dihydrodipicolinate synthase family protein [Rhodospirillaceae bacterium]MBT5308391.1 dihydrodipicolinate synthase family protein [Rhodospirillaceae bacterium]
MTRSEFSHSGIYAAALTPLNADLSPDEDALVRHGRWLLDNGCDGLAVLGTTGEANSFSVSERMSMIEAMVEGGVPVSSLMPGTGCCSISDTVELTRHALGLGVTGALMLPPFYYKGVSDDGLFAAYAQVIDRIDDDRLRLYLYHFPQMSSVPLSYDLIARLIEAYPGIIAGMKDSSGEFTNMSGASERFPGFAVFSGSDEFLLDILNAGGAGCITAVSNIASSLATRVLRAWRDGEADNATDLQEKLTTVRETVCAYPLSAALKEIMARHSGDGEWRNIRPPLQALDDAGAADLLARLADTGFSLPALNGGVR